MQRFNNPGVIGTSIDAPVETLEHEEVISINNDESLQLQNDASVVRITTNRVIGEIVTAQTTTETMRKQESSATSFSVCKILSLLIFSQTFYIIFVNLLFN